MFFASWSLLWYAQSFSCCSIGTHIKVPFQYDFSCIPGFAPDDYPLFGLSLIALSIYLIEHPDPEILQSVEYEGIMEFVRDAVSVLFAFFLIVSSEGNYWSFIGPSLIVIALSFQIFCTCSYRCVYKNIIPAFLSFPSKQKLRFIFVFVGKLSA